MRIDKELVLDAVHALMRGATGIKLVGDLHERPSLAGLYPPLDPKLRRRLARIREAGVLFIHIPKNAGMSVSSTLYGDQLFHPTVRYYARVAPDVMRDLPSFAIWRHPAERFVSAFRYAKAGGAPGARVARAFRKQYMAFGTIDDALDHVAQTHSLFDIDHIFRPQFWYVADAAGRIAVDQICLIEDLERAVEDYALPGLDRIAWLNRSDPIDIELRSDQVARLRCLYPIDFAIHEALVNKTMSVGSTARRAA